MKACAVDDCHRPARTRGFCSTHYDRFWRRGTTDLLTSEDRFFRKVEKQADGCWIWTGTRTRKGYGFIKANSQRGYAHRWAYEHFIGPIPDGLQIDHLCRVPSCVNPQHLEPVTPRENLLRGDTLVALNAAKTHCKNGHEFTPENTRWNSKGHRACRACGRAHAAAKRPQGRVPNSAKTQCPSGHAYSVENTYITKNGGRICRACQREYARELRAKRRTDRT